MPKDRLVVVNILSRFFIETIGLEITFHLLAATLVKFQPLQTGT